MPDKPENADLTPDCGPDPVSITRASFQAANNYAGLPPEERRRRRAESRRTWFPPGLIAQSWVTDDCFRYDFGEKGSGDRYIVGKAFEFDGASVPFPLTVFVPQTHSLYLSAAALHDWLYQNEKERVAREKADAIFREAMLVLGMNWVWAGLMWRAVRAGGWASWYSRDSDGLQGWILRLPRFFRVILVWIITLVRGIGGAVFHDLFHLAEYRAEAKRIAKLDHEENEDSPPCKPGDRGAGSG